MDGIVLAEQGREICSQDAALYGPPSSSASSSSPSPSSDREYGTRLGWGLVDYLVDCHVKDSSRTLSTVGLLAANAYENELYLVDVTGLYPCRALATGSHSDLINRFLARVDFMELSVEDGTQALLNILRDCRQGKNPDAIEENEDTKEESEEDMMPWHIPDSSMVEITIMKTGGDSIERRREIFLPSS